MSKLRHFHGKVPPCAGELVTLILVASTEAPGVTFGSSLAAKAEILRARANGGGGLLLAVWAGATRMDVFEVDGVTEALWRSQMGTGSASG